MEIKIRFSRTADDFNKALRLRFSWWRWAAIVTIVLFLGVIVTPSLGPSDKGTPHWISIMTMIIVLYLIRFYLRNKAGARLLKKNPNLGREEEVTFSDDGILAVTATGESKGLWSNYVKATITRDIILIYPNSTVFLCYPRRAFTKEEYASLTALIKASIPDTKER